jgi:hypothetical protein
MSKYIAVDGATLKLSAGTATGKEITSSPSSNSKIEGKGIYNGTINVKISGYSGSTVATQTGGGLGTIDGTASKTKVDGNPVVLKGDESGDILITGNFSNGNPGAQETIKVSIDDPGQDLWKAE